MHVLAMCERILPIVYIFVNKDQLIHMSSRLRVKMNNKIEARIIP